MPIKNLTENNPYVEKVENLLMQEEIQNMNMNKTCLQKQETEEIILNYDINSKTDTI
ncbi:24237_t:CDS:2 [Cetraspora pellucida]|uniref:24237_t:CDS:1 n=1 Tax=Cetraspora pellucida TaxID=1433469 RepID=A0A9N8ZLH9_9GLOM|nr:24237_t:CDS:2 [Cetraspora pellucida]